jgi:hypothetical protein
MYKVIVKGEACASNEDGVDYKGESLKKFDGIDCQDCFTDYMDSGRVTAKDVLSGGYLNFKYENGKLWSITEYQSTRVLTDQELEEVKSYTQGQWSDGIGEGFEQFPCNSDEDYISPWFGGQEITSFNNVAEVRNQKIDSVIDNPFEDREESFEDEIKILSEIGKEMGIIDPLTYMDLGMDLKELYNNNHNYQIATLRAIRAFKARGFEITFKG